MASQKKRTKKYHPKAVMMPSLIPSVSAAEHWPDLALKLHMGIANLIEAPSVIACNELTRQLATLAGALSYAHHGKPLLELRTPSTIAINSAIHTTQEIVERTELLGKLVVTPIQAKSLKAASGALDRVLAQVPAACYEEARRKVAAWTGVSA